MVVAPEETYHSGKAAVVEDDPLTPMLKRLRPSGRKSRTKKKKVGKRREKAEREKRKTKKTQATQATAFKVTWRQQKGQK